MNPHHHRLNNCDKDLYRQRRIISTPQEVTVDCEGKTLVSFCSNNYLGLAHDPAVIAAFQKGAEQYGVGSGGSALINGYTKAHQQCEIEFADFLQRDRALFLANGYVANISTLMTVASAETIIYQDKLNHASLIDGAHFSKATLKRYAHKDTEHLTRFLTQAPEKNSLIATDAVFSMEGDLAPLPQLAKVAQHYQADLMVDDAHGIGVLGKGGRGSLEHFNLSARDVPILSCPLGKAFGSYGAIIAGSEDLIESLVQFARPYIYSTALPPALACAAMAALKIIRTESERRNQLNALIAFFKKAAIVRGINLLPSDTPIQTLRLGEVKKTLWVSEQLKQQGFLVPALRPPTVAKNAASLRMTLSCLHTEKQINNLLDCLAEMITHAPESHCQEI